MIEKYYAFLEITYLGSSVLSWVIALITTVVTLIILTLLKKFIIKKFTPALNAATPINELAESILDVVGKTQVLFIFVISIFMGIRVLSLPEKISDLIYSITMITIFIQIGLWGNASIRNWTTKSIFIIDSENPSIATVKNLIAFVLQFTLWTVIIILTLDNIGFNITTLIAGVGVGGLAISLAAQNILKDLFASVSIVLDKPFVIGDFIVIGDFSGTVENIGLKTTKIRSIGGELLIFSNTDLLESRIRNYKRMIERRVLFSIGVVYQTNTETLQKIPLIAKEIIEAQEKTRFDRAHFKSYGDSSLNYEIVYFVLDSDYNMFMNIQEKINIEIFSRFQKEEIDFAYPTRTLFIEKE